jgi:hypothetical protein
MATGRCRHCGQAPIAFDAPICPICYGKDPNPSSQSKYAKRGFLIGTLVGAVGFGIWGFFGYGDVGGFIVGFLLGTVPGFIVGLLGGWLFGVIRGNPPSDGERSDAFTRRLGD